MSRNSHGFYQGCDVSDTFMSRWRSMVHTGKARPYNEVWVRRVRLHRSWHYNWPDPQFGQLVGQSIRRQWYPDLVALDDWTQLPGIHEIDLDQSFDNNGITTATVMADNVRWRPKTGPHGDYHLRERGYLWPWKGFTPPQRPNGGVLSNEWHGRLPNAQILIRQGYGSDTAAKTFTGLIDNLDATLHPDHMQLTARDFGSVLVDSHVFGWNKTKGVHDPISFVPANYRKLKWAQGASQSQTHRWVLINDATDVVRCALRWAGFKEWEIEDAGVNLSVPYTVDKSHTLMDMITDIATALGYNFFVTEPTADNDLSMGVPVFRRPSVLIHERSLPISIRDKQLLTDLKPKHENKNDRYIIRVRGTVNKKVGRTVGGDTAKRVTFTYWPPWIRKMAGVIKQLTYYNVGSNGVLGLQTVQQCMVAALLIAIQIALGRDTAVAQCPGQPGVGLDSFIYVVDAPSGVNSRIYVTNRKSTMTLGGDGSGPVQSSQSGSSSSELLWATELGGSLCDNSEFDKIVAQYQTATHGGRINSWDVGFD